MAHGLRVTDKVELVVHVAQCGVRGAVETNKQEAMGREELVIRCHPWCSGVIMGTDERTVMERDELDIRCQPWCARVVVGEDELELMEGDVLGLHCRWGGVRV